MKYYLKLGLMLLLITSIASGILALLNTKTEPIIENNQRKEAEAARKEVLPEATTFKEVKAGDFSYYVGKDANGKIVGYTFIAAKFGYSSEVQTMVGVRPDLTINNIKIIFQSETPGLGANCMKPDFAPKFQNRKLDELKVDKDGGPIKSMTGATITTRAVTNSIKEALSKLKKALPKNEDKIVAAESSRREVSK